jgi:hydroxymethylglutaryl-CoA reductase (NADPH)
MRVIKTVQEKRTELETLLSLKLPSIASFTLDEKQASTKHCENMIGAVQVPIGVAGPVKIKNQEAGSKDYYVPLATTEGALVASVNRGCKAITQSGGTVVATKKIGITRAPVFAVTGIAEGNSLVHWVQKHFLPIKKMCEETSSHLTLLDITSWMVGKNVYLRFRFDTQDAMGMNMATIACTSAAAFIEKQTATKLVSLSGNMCVDKKPNALNVIAGRGIQVWAEVHLAMKTLQEVLKTSTDAFYETAQRKLVYGSFLSQTLGSNCHMANVLAAIFLATGQDIAHVAESAMGITTVEQENDGIYIAIYLPDLPIGTVGGGTTLATQKEALTILGVAGGNNGKNAETFAEIIGASVLAGEISLLASLSENSLALAHQKLGRGGK